MKPTWEEVDATAHQYTMRLVVPGGWLYRHGYEDAASIPDTMVFVPIPWNLTSEQYNAWMKMENHAVRPTADPTTWDENVSNP